MTEYVVWLDDPECHRVELTGGKGASLGRMQSAGMPVPPGFVVVASALPDELARLGIRSDVESMTSRFGSEPDDKGLVTGIQSLFADVVVWDGLADQISAAYDQLGDSPFVAVRSSACAEDGETASFAGQQETYLNVVGSDQVIEKMVQCWASFFSERALFYRKSKGSLGDLGMAVVVQRQLDSDKSGVMFTHDPIRQRSDQMVIEAAFGLGEALVSGLITPDNYICRRDGRLKKARVARQDQMIVRGANGGTVTVDLDHARAVEQVLTEEELSLLVDVGLGLETAFGSPQDIEWAFEGDELYVLQSRPITT